MSVTLEVSKLSGWLNAAALCRESNGGHAVRGEGAGWEARGGGRRRCTQRAGEGLDCRFGGRARDGEEHTENMLFMVATLEVSKLSGWLNADANCRESNGGRTVRGEVRAGRREAAGDGGARSVQGRGSTADSRQGTGRSARGTCRPCP